MSYSANDNQNYFVSAGRTTSRVVAQPGGQCSISIGGWTPEELERARKLREQREAETKQKENTENPKEEPATSAPSTEKPKEEAVVENITPAPTVEESKVEMKATTDEPATVPAKTPGVSSNAFASSASTNSFNVITDRPTSRVLRPPGGHCSIVLG